MKKERRDATRRDFTTQRNIVKLSNFTKRIAMMIDNINWSTIVESRIQTVISRKAVASDERVGADILLFDVQPINQNRLPQ